MSRRILMVEDDESRFAPMLSACGVTGAEIFRCRAREWGGDTTAVAPDLLVPVALESTPEWIGFFGGLAHLRRCAPVLAVLDSAVGGELLAAASRASDDFILWNADRVGELQARIQRLLPPPPENTDDISDKFTRSAALARLVGEDAGFLAVVARIPVVARSEGVVLILGETGTGKELCARAVHHLSARRHLPFIPVDCAALPDHLLENELFGHVRGAFTDAHRDQSGLVALAEGGTLFLDEIDSLALPVQAKLLRLIEERAYKPLGGERFVQANIRIIAASNRPLVDLVRQKQFRSDLFFRLNVLELHLPALRARRGDIALLARHFVRQLTSDGSIARKQLAPAAVDKLMRASWPGNVRELFNVIHRAAVFSEGPVILPADLVTSDDHQDPLIDTREGFRRAKARSVEAFERTYVMDLLRKHNGNITRAAQEARKDRRAFARLMIKHRIDRLTLKMG